VVLWHTIGGVVVFADYSEVNGLQYKGTGVSLILSGILLLLILGVMIVTDANPIGLSKNAMSKLVKPDMLFEAPGSLAAADNGYMFHHDKQILRKIDIEGNTLWEKEFTEEQIIWKGLGGFVTINADSMNLWDCSGQLLFQQQGLLEDIRVLDFKGDYILISGKLQATPYTALLNTKGTVIWIIPAEGTVISGQVDSKGLLTLLNLIDQNVNGKIRCIDSKGQTIWDKSYDDLILVTGLVEGKVAAVSQSSVFLADRKGHELWQYPIESALCAADISEQGCIALALRERRGTLNQQSHPKLSMLSSKGELLWSYSLSHEPDKINIGKDAIYVSDRNQILIFSLDGLLMSSLKIAGEKQLQIVEPHFMILNCGHKASVYKL
jgi:outer membrane protein assembly factor BamB